MFQKHQNYRLLVSLSPNQFLIITAAFTRVEIQSNHEEVVLIQEISLTNLHQSCKITTNGITLYNDATKSKQKRIMELPLIEGIYFAKKNCTLTDKHLEKTPLLKAELQSAPITPDETEYINHHVIIWPTLFLIMLIVFCVVTL